MTELKTDSETLPKASASETSPPASPSASTTSTPPTSPPKAEIVPPARAPGSGVGSGAESTKSPSSPLPSISVLEARLSVLEKIVSESSPAELLNAVRVKLQNLELALASLAAPTLSQVEHDGHNILQLWYDDIKSFFHSVAGIGQVKPVEVPVASGAAGIPTPVSEPPK